MTKLVDLELDAELERVIQLVDVERDAWTPFADKNEETLIALERRGLVLWRRRFPAGKLEAKLTAAGRKALA